MPFNVLIVPDKFKGTLTAQAAAEAIAQGWRKARPHDTLELLPMSDGGDGFGEVISGLIGARLQTIDTLDAAHRPCRAQWWWEPKTKTAVIESARIIGLAMVQPTKFHPFNLDTFGLGAVFQAAARKGAARCLMGIGGSATNDGGFGVARSLGWTFLDAAGEPITQWTALHSLARLRPPRQTRWFRELLVAVDVQNPLLGARGCTRIYGPQKGLTPPDFPLAERCLRRLARVVEQNFERCYADEPGAGAAGGLGFGLSCFLGGHLESGFDLFARYAGLGRRIRRADLVITGEGAIDPSTLMGKGVGQIAQYCLKLGIPCLGLAGSVVAGKKTKSPFSQARGLTQLTTLQAAKKHPALWLARLAEQVARTEALATTPRAG
jgi:glycerate kinase